MPKALNLTGQRFGRLMVEARAGRLGSNSAWLVQCDCGRTTIVRSNKLRSGHTQSCGCLRAETIGRLRKKDIVDYAGAHCRVVALRGRAKEHACVDCGDTATEWSYDRLDPNERIAVNDHGRGCAYSLDPSHYHPRCKPCHAAFDAPSRKAMESHAN